MLRSQQYSDNQLSYFERKIKMKKAIYIILLPALVSITQANLVDDFESYELGELELVTEMWHHIGRSDKAGIWQDDYDPNDQTLWSQDNGGQQLGFYGVVPGGYEIAEGQTKTFYFQFRMSNPYVNHYFGLTDVDEPSVFGDFRVQVGFLGWGNVTLTVHNGDTEEWLWGLTNIGWATPYYNMWIVISNVSQTFDVYLSYEGEPDAYYLIADDFAFRGSAEGPLDCIFGLTTGANDQRVWYDDFYLAHGSKLTKYPTGDPVPTHPFVEEVSNTEVRFHWKAAADPSGEFAVNPAVVDEYVFMRSGADDPNMYYIGATGIDPGTAEPDSEYPGASTIPVEVDGVYYWAVVDAVEGYEESLTPGVSTLEDVDPNNLIGPPWLYEAVKSIPAITVQPVDARVFATDPSATFTVEFTNPIYEATITWYKNDVALQDGVGNVSIDTDTHAYSTLTISSPTIADEGKYYCVLSVDEITEETQSETCLLVIKKTLAQFDFENNLSDSSGNSAPSGIAKYVDPSDPNEMEATSTTLTYDADGIEGYAVSLTSGQYIDLDVDGYPKAGPLDTVGDIRGAEYERTGFGRGMDEGSMLCWIKPSPTDRTYAIYTNANAKDYTHFGLTTATINNARMVIRGSNWDESYQELGTASGGLGMDEFSLQDGQWHMFAATWDIGGVRVYINGEQVAANNAGFPEMYTAWERSNLLGASRIMYARWILYDLFEGSIDSLRVYNYVISADEIVAEYETVSGNTPCANHNFTNNELNFDNTASSYCKVDLGDFAAFAEQWLMDGWY